ncbi:MAG: hypothetical protein IJ043_06925 [Clostridia bacterium]|nr:hypothetical protein [Clostridia bacterium]
MKDNPLLKYAELLAFDIELLCKNLEHRGNSNIIFQIRKSSLGLCPQGINSCIPTAGIV